MMLSERAAQDQTKKSIRKTLLASKLTWHS